MKKKSLLITMAIVMGIFAVMGIAGCASNGKQAAIDSFNKASEKFMAADSASLDSDFSLDTSLQGITLSITGDGNCQYIKNSADPLSSQMALTGNMFFLGEQSKSAFYLVDKKLYTSFGAIGDASTVTNSMYDLSTSSSSYGDLVAELQSGNLPDISKYVTEGSVDNGKVKLNIDIAGYVSELLETTAANSANAQGSSSSAGSIADLQAQAESMLKGSTCTIEAQMDSSGMFTSMSFALSLTIDSSALSGTTGSTSSASSSTSSSSDTITCNMTFNVNNISIDNVSKIDFPDFSGYSSAETLTLDGLTSMAA